MLQSVGLIRSTLYYRTCFVLNNNKKMRKEHNTYKISSLNPPKMLKVGEVKYKYIHYYEKISKDYEMGKSVIKCIHPKLT